MTTIIYVLTDCWTNVRYVGKTVKSLKTRLRRHWRDSRQDCHRTRWISRERREKRSISISAIAWCDGDGNEEERAWIAYYKSIGAELVNCTDGGEGALGYKHKPESFAKMCKPRVWSEAAREAMRERNRSRIFTEELRALHARNSKARWADPEARAKMLESLKAAPPYECTQEDRDRRAANARKQWQDPAHRANMAVKMKARIVTDETRAKMSRSARAKPPVTDETRRRLSEALRKRDPACIEKRKRTMANKTPEEKAAFRQKISDATRGRRMSEETKAKLSRSKTNPSAEVRQHYADGAKRRWAKYHEAKQRMEQENGTVISLAAAGGGEDHKRPAEA